MRSEAEVVNYLKRKRTSPQDITSTINKLKDLKFVDDLKFCSWWQESRDRNHPVGARVLQQELRQKGVPREIISQVIDVNRDTEFNRAHQALAKKRHIADPVSFLARRGFSWEVISLTTKDLQGTIEDR